MRWNLVLAKIQTTPITLREKKHNDSSRTFFLLRFDNLQTIVFDSERRKSPALPTTTDDPI